MRKADLEEYSTEGKHASFKEAAKKQSSQEPPGGMLSWKPRKLSICK